MKPSKVVVLTGGIGAGKSSVANILAERFPVLSADEVSREVIDRPEVRREICERLTDAYFSDGNLDRKGLARFVFADGERTRVLNEIMHGAVGRTLSERARKLTKEGAALVFVEIPLYFESGANFPCDAVWVVTADESVRIERTMRRDGLTEAEIRDRIRRQLPFENANNAYTVIENNGDMERLRAEVNAGLADLGRT